jgi:hypothetical protein
MVDGEILQESARKANTDLRIIERRGWSAAPPAFLAFPETYYLKSCLSKLGFKK